MNRKKKPVETGQRKHTKQEKIKPGEEPSRIFPKLKNLVHDSARLARAPGCPMCANNSLVMEKTNKSTSAQQNVKITWPKKQR